MKIFGFEFGKRKKRNKESVHFEAPISASKDALPKPSRQKTIAIVKIPRVRNPVLAFKPRPGGNEFEQPEYNMVEIGRIEDIESYVQRAFTQKEGLMFKEGWELIGKNAQTIKYIKHRFEQLSAAGRLPFAYTLRGVGEDLIRYSNAFIVKVRNDKASGGKLRRMIGRKSAIEPVAAYFPMPVSTVRFQRDDNGKILKYRQTLPSGKYKDFSPEDVIHVYFRKKKGFLVGTPSLIPVKDDIRALRRIEENMELLIYQHLFPLYHYTVGTTDAPADTYPDGTREVDVVKQEIEMMPGEGMMVTPERHEIKAIGAEGRALRAEGYLTHFKQRIFAGLGVSAVDMSEGDSANRATADNMSRNMIDDVKHYQRVWEMFLNEFVIKELLLESTFTNPIDDDNLVRIKCSEIDLDAKIKVENHAVNAFGGHAIKHDELRAAFGKEPFTDDEWDNTFWKLIEEPKLMMQSADEPYSAYAQAIARASITAPEQSDFDKENAERKKELAAGQKAASSGKPGPASSKKTSGQRAAKAVVQPSNQHGTKNSPEKRRSSFSVADMVAPNNTITDLFNDLQEQALFSLSKGTLSSDYFKQLSISAGDVMHDRLARVMRIRFRDGYRTIDASLESLETSVPMSVIESRSLRLVNRLVDTLVRKMTTQLDTNSPATTQQLAVTSVFDSLRYRSRFMYNSEQHKAYNYGIFRALRAQGFETANVVAEPDACDECQAKAGIINLINTDINDIPGFHPNCVCVITKPE